MKEKDEGMWIKWGRLPAWQKILLALVSGTLLGVLLGHRAVYLKPLGSIFINAINMMVAPVVFTAIVCAITSMNGDRQRMKRLGFKAIGLYTVSMAVAAVMGIAMALLLGPGKHFHPDLGGASVATAQAAPALMDMLVNIVPSNPVNAFAHGNIIQILVFAVLLGIAINLTGEPAQPVAKLFHSFSLVVFRLTSLIMSFAPVGIFALMAWVTGEMGLAALLPLFKLVATVYLGCIAYSLVFYGFTLAYVSRLNPFYFFRRILGPLLLAFTSSSSAATLPLTMKTAEKNLGIPAEIGRFLLPLGTSLNLNGLSVYLGIATVFAANMYGIHLGLTHYFTIVVSIILTCMGAGGIPGTGIIAMSAVMTSVGLPLGAIPLLAGVDRLNDMAQTTTNVMGDLFAATVISKQENELDLKVYNEGAEPTDEKTENVVV
ncbi:MAG: dicarboxylate/amino acid:cation symporter [Gammaproteobacteria bacterium]|nr:dicarboxylate/amino acid:cation symporter [Gammaproteobacteria bacterium]